MSEKNVNYYSITETWNSLGWKRLFEIYGTLLLKQGQLEKIVQDHV